MSVNRYTGFQPQQYVSTYVPLPLEYIDQVGALKQGVLDKQKQELESDTDPFNKLGDLSISLKGYTDEGVGDLVYNDLELAKQQAISELSAERNKLASDLQSGKIDDDEFKRLSKQHVAKASNVYNQLNSYKTEVDAIKKYNEEFSKNAEFGLNPYFGERALSTNTKYINDLKSGNIKPFVGVDIAEKYDIEETLKDMSTNWTKEGGESVEALQGYINKYGWEGIKKHRVYDYASDEFDNPMSKVNQYANLEADFILNSSGITDDKIRNKLKSEILQDRKDKFVESAVNRIAGIKRTADKKSDATQLRAMDEMDRLKGFEMGLQFVGADPNNKQNDSNLTRVLQKTLGSNNFEFRNGELHYNPIQEGTKYINVFGKNFDAKKAEADGNIEINGVKFAVTSGGDGKLNVMLPDGNSWKGVNYDIKTASKNQGLLSDAQKLDSVAKRLGYTGSDMKGKQKALENYMMDVYNLEATSTAFPVGLENWLSKEFGTNVDKEGNILNPAQLSNMTLKNADGTVYKGNDESTILADKANILKGARISGFSKSLISSDIKPGDLEITGADGNRYILSTGKSNLEQASKKSLKLMKSVNNWIINGDKDYDYSAIENSIRSSLGNNITKDAIHVTGQEVVGEDVYTAYVFNNKGITEKKVLITDKEGNPKDQVSLAEAARRMDTEGIKQHLSFYNPKSTERQEKEYSKYEDE